MEPSGAAPADEGRKGIDNVTELGTDLHSLDAFGRRICAHVALGKWRPYHYRPTRSNDAPCGAKIQHDTVTSGDTRRQDVTRHPPTEVNLRPFATPRRAPVMPSVADRDIDGRNVAKPFTAKQGQYLAYIYYYTKIHGRPPAESDFQRFFRVTPPAVHQMIKTLEAHGFINREPGVARSIRLRLTRAQLPDLE